MTVAVLAGCRQDSTGTSPRQSWRTPLFVEHGPTAESIYPVFWKNTFIAAKIVHNSPPVLMAINTEDGTLQWQHTDTTTAASLYYNLKPALIGNTLIVPMGKTTLGIGPDDGQPKWRVRPPGHPEQFVEQVGKDRFVQAVNDWEGRRSTIFLGNAHDGHGTVLLAADWPDSTRVLWRTPVQVNDSLLLFTSISLRQLSNATTAHWHLLHLGSKSVLQQGVAYPPNNMGHGVTKQPIVADSKAILVAFDQIVCLDMPSGEERWRTDMPRDMLTSAPLLAGRHLYCAMEDGFLYQLDMEDGRILWKAAVSGTPGRPVLHKGLVWVVGGADGVLHGISETGGEQREEVYAPNHHYLENGFYRRFIGADPGREVMVLFDGHSFRGYVF